MEFSFIDFRERERERLTQDRNIIWLPSIQNRTLNLSMCPDLEQNQQPFNVWDDAQLTKPY